MLHAISVINESVVLCLEAETHNDRITLDQIRGIKGVKLSENTDPDRMTVDLENVIGQVNLSAVPPWAISKAELSPKQTDTPAPGGGGEGSGGSGTGGKGRDR